MNGINALVIGAGNIGAIQQQELRIIPGWEAGGVMTRGKLVRREQTTLLRSLREISDEEWRHFDIVFLSIPSGFSVTPEISALDYLLHFMRLGIPVVTCEKDAFSTCYEQLVGSLSKIGYSACVGGGTRMIPILRDRMRVPGEMEIYAVLNGTLNYIFTEMANNNRALGEAVHDAQRLGFAEPGVATPLGVLKAEMTDVKMKAAILFNTCIAKGKFVCAHDIHLKPVLERQNGLLTSQAKERRCFVSIVREGTASFDQRDCIGGFEHRVEGWLIQGGFLLMESCPAMGDHWPKGVSNALVVRQGKLGKDGTYLLASGPGAGAHATVASTINDAFRLLHLPR